MSKTCDNKSVGILVWRDGKLLMVERKKYNFGFAVPAGHQDGDNPETCAKKELWEEVGLNAKKLATKLARDLKNPCGRENGAHHEWTIVEAEEWDGEIRPSEDETKGYLWADRETIRGFARALEKFAERKKIPLDLDHLPELTRATNEDEKWKAHPGLEPPFYFFFKDLGIS